MDWPSSRRHSRSSPTGFPLGYLRSGESYGHESIVAHLRAADLSSTAMRISGMLARVPTERTDVWIERLKRLAADAAGPCGSWGATAGADE